MSLFLHLIYMTQRPQQDEIDDTFIFCTPSKNCISSYLESISEQLQFWK